MTSRLAVPGAILLGCIVIAVAVYLGLSGRGAEPEVEIRSSGQPAAEATPEPPREVAPKASQFEVDAAARAALEKTRPLMLEKCWGPAVKENPEPGTSEYRFDVSFDEKTGKVNARGVSEVRGKPSRPDVARCLRELPMEYEIAPPGYNARVELRFTLP